MEIIKKLHGVNPMSPELIDRLAENLKTISLREGEHLLVAGQVCENVYFVEKGLLRSISLQGGKEITNWFMGENDVVFAVKSFIRQTASTESIQALEDCILHYITYKELQEIYRNFSEFNWHGRVLTEDYYVQNMDRTAMLANSKGDHRYRLLLENQPEYANRVQNEYLASYLGVSVRTLQRIKERAAKRNNRKK